MNFSYMLQAAAAQALQLPGTNATEEYIIRGVQGLKLFIETIGALIIGLGVAIALYYFIRGTPPGRCAPIRRRQKRSAGC